MPRKKPKSVTALAGDSRYRDIIKKPALVGKGKRACTDFYRLCHDSY